MPGTYLASRAADLGTDLPHLLNLKPNEPKRLPLQQHSLSDLNRVNSKPSIRILDKNAIPGSDKVYEKSPFPRLPSQVLKPSGGAENSEPVSPALDAEYTTDSRPATRDGSEKAPSPLHLHTGHFHRMSISTTTSNADTLVAHSVFSPTTAVFSPISQRFSIDSDHKNAIGVLEPLEELPLERSTSFESHQDSDQENYAASSPRFSPRTAPSNHGYSVAPPGGPMDSSFIMPSRSGELDYHASSPQQAPAVSQSSTSHQIRYVSSSDSIRPQFASIRPSAVPAVPAIRPEQELWLEEHSVPSLSVARKRAHRKSASLSTLTSQSRMTGANAQLSTIQSESDVNYARLVYDSPALDGPMWPRKRRTTVASSAYSESVASPHLGPSLHTSSSYETTPNLTRENSAIPEPLFSSSVALPQEPFQPGHTHNTSELDDTIGELQPPAHTLRQKRSGYIIKSRSQTEFKSTYSLGGERWTDSLFPAWARKFYGGKAYLLSNNASRITLGGSHLPGNNERNESIPDLPRPPTRGKFWRHTTVDSFAPSNVSPGTRPGSGLSNWETIYSHSSPRSSRLPSLLRPKQSRGQMRSGLNVMTASRDSLEISELPGDDVPPVPPIADSWTRKLRAKRSFRNPLKSSHVAASPETDDEDATTTALGRKTSRQITWRTRSHTVGALPTEPSLNSMPHLVQNERLARSKPMFRVPSFDEPLREKWLGPCNRQILAFCLGFVFPPLWILASFLALPHRPSAAFSVANDSVLDVDEKGRDKAEAEVEQAAMWSWDSERTFLKAKWWQTLNRVMSVVGLGIMALIIALAVLAAT